MNTEVYITSLMFRHPDLISWMSMERLLLTSNQALMYKGFPSQLVLYAQIFILLRCDYLTLIKSDIPDPLVLHDVYSFINVELL